MLIARDQLIDGVPAVEVRDLLRRLAGYVFTVGGCASVLEVDGTDLSTMLDLLRRRGLIEPAADSHVAPLLCGHGEDEPGERWQTTVAGNALAKARIGIPMPRRRAEALLAGVVARAGEVNRDRTQLFFVETVELFGSLSRSDTTMVGDIDLRVLIAHRYMGDALVEELGRRWPGSPLDALHAATRQLHRHLTGGSRRIDLQLDETVSMPLPDGADTVVVYTRR